MQKIILSLWLISALSPLSAQSVTYVFQPNTPAKAAQVNKNFSDLIQAIKQKNSQISALVSKDEQHNKTIATLTQRIETLEKKLAAVSVGKDSKGHQALYIDGVNVHIRNGSQNQQTDSVNGVGNLIIGYHKPSARLICNVKVPSNDKSACQKVWGIWATNQRLGSHNIIVGDEHDYTSYGALISGTRNAVNAANASVIGGYQTIVSGEGGFAAAGASNYISGSAAGVVGGSFNISSGQNSYIGGGWLNKATGSHASVSGGEQSEARGESSSVNGGRANLAKGKYSAVGGGNNNTAGGHDSTVAGSNNLTTTLQYEIRP